MIPTRAFLDSVEQLFGVRYPDEFRAFCDRARCSLRADALRAAGVELIGDLDRLRTVNRSVGEEQWGDYEQAIAGRRRPKAVDRLWGGLLPFALEDRIVYGFDVDKPQSRRVLVWSVHTVVAEYPSFGAFCAACTRSAAPSRQ